MLQTIFRFWTQDLAARRETNLKQRDILSKIPLLFENRFYALFRKSVKWYISAVVNIHASQIGYYEKQLDVSLTSLCSSLSALLMLVWKLSSVKLYFFEGQQVFISVELSSRRGATEFPGFRVLVAIGTTSTASNAGGERGFFLMNIIKTKQVCIFYAGQLDASHIYSRLTTWNSIFV